MLQFNFKRFCLAFILTIALAYPVSALASVAAAGLGMEALSPPFTPKWVGVWVFAVGGGIGASFIHVAEVDKHLKYPTLAKIFLGTFWGMAISLAIDAMTSTPMGAIMLFTVGASSFSAPICAGFMVYISDQRRQNSVYDAAKNAATMRTFGRKIEEDNDNESNQV